MKRKRGYCLLIGLIFAGLAAGVAWGGPETEKITRVFGPFELEPGSLMQMPGKDETQDFAESFWVLSYKAEIIGSEGDLLSHEFNCHSILRSHTGEWRGRQRNGAAFKGLFSDGNNIEIRVPEGFGIYYEANEKLQFTPMFNNRTAEVVNASMRVTIEGVPASDLTQPLTPLYSTIESFSVPDLYMVDTGVTTRERTFRFPYDGTIHAMGVHFHPYGRSVELIDLSRGETVWAGVAERDEAGRLLRMPSYSSVEGHAFRSDEPYLLRATYDNPTEEPQDAMAGLFILFSTQGGTMPLPTTPAAANVEADPGHPGAHH